MATEPPEHDAHANRLRAFRDDLARLEPTMVIRRHITTGDPVGLDSETYFLLRERIAAHFQLHPSAIVLVGSCRLGFSLKPKHRFRAITKASDVDVAVIADRLFDLYWDAVFDAVQSDRNWAINGGKLFVRDLFSGWLSPHMLPSGPRFEQARAWSEFFAELTRDRLCGYRTITGRLYRSWSRLEAYQRIMVEKCQAESRRTS